MNPRPPLGHGQVDYVTCSRCGTVRPTHGLRYVGDEPPVCADVVWCGKQAGVGLGKLDADKGAP